MKLVEIIRGQATDDETDRARLRLRAARWARRPIVVNDSARLLHQPRFGTYVMEGAAMLEEGIAAPLVEQRPRQAGMPVGPLAVLDETSCRLGARDEQTRAPTSRPKGAPTNRRPARRWSSAWSRSSVVPAGAAGGGFYDYPAAAQAAVARAEAAFEKAGLASDFRED